MAATEPIRASGELPTEEDLRLRQLMSDLLAQQNKSLVDLAQKMLTVTFAALGFVLALQERWFGGSSPVGLARIAIIAALVLLLGSVPVYLGVIKGYRLALTLFDYQDVESELSRLGIIRNLLSSIGIGMTAVAAALLAVAILG